MSFLALAISVCTPMYCGAYNIDTFDADSIGSRDCQTQLTSEFDSFREAWDGENGKTLKQWLDEHSIFESPESITSAGFECIKYEEPDDTEPQLMYAVVGV